MKNIVLIITVLNFLHLLSFSQETASTAGHYNEASGLQPNQTLGDPVTTPVKVHVIYDNYIFKEGTQSDWGFSVLIEGMDKCILFDTGTQPEIFNANFRGMGIDASKIDEIFISHEHGDHIGGLGAVLGINPYIKVVVPETFSNGFFRIPATKGSVTELVSNPAQVCKGLYTTGINGEAIPEQSMVLNTGKGLVLITGCAHPGIINILAQVKKDFGKEVYMVIGGFHLMNKSEKQINEIIDNMKQLGVLKCGATHCTGERQIKWFKKAFGENFIELGSGNVLTIL